MDWERYYAEIEGEVVDDILARLPAWQETLTRAVQQTVGEGRLLEAGSGFGVTSLLVGAQADRVLMDVVPKAVRVAKAEFEKRQQSAAFLAGDLLRLPFADGVF